MAKIKNKNSLLIYVLIFLLGFMLALVLLTKEEGIQQPVKQEIEGILEGNANIIAVTQENEGIIGKVEVEITQGTGKVLVNTNPFLEPDTQFSATIAANVASNYTNFDLSDKNVIYNFDIPGNVLGGGSAGLSMTLATIAAIQGKEVNNIGMTGAILPNGDIGLVGAVLEKGIAVGEQDLGLFLIPSGQSTFTYYEPVTERRTLKNGLTVIRTTYVPKTANLTQYLQEEYDINIIEVKNIQDTIEYAF